MTPLDHVALLRSIRGRFRSSRAERWLPRVYAVFFSIVPPTLLIYALFQFGIPRPPLSADQWTCIIVAPASFALGIFFWCTADVEYEFTGDEILCRRASSVRWRLPIDSITDVRVEVLPRSNSTAWHLQAGTVCRSVLVIESLAEYVTRTTKT